jgi:hypothetical protein
MKSAWKALREANFPEEAMKVFFDVSVLEYERMKEGDLKLSAADPLAVAQRASELGAHFRAQYQRAEAMALEAMEKGGTP